MGKEKIKDSFWFMFSYKTFKIAMHKCSYIAGLDETGALDTRLGWRHHFVSHWNIPDS